MSSGLQARAAVKASSSSGNFLASGATATSSSSGGAMGQLQIQQQQGGQRCWWGGGCGTACSGGKGAAGGPTLGSPSSAAAATMQSVPLLARLAWQHIRLLVLSLALLAVLYVYLPCGLLILYNYYWWILYSSTVSLAAPGSATGAAVAGGGGGGGAQQLQPFEAPRILHQTWRDKDVPEKWREAQKSCIDAHPGYEYRLWTDQEAEQLIETKFPWFARTYKAYPHNIQRADVMRYFVLYEYGGIYLDLDVQCLKSLDAYRYTNFTAPKTYPIGVSNDVLIARKGDPFARQLIHNLADWQKWFFVRYATVMFSTGPMFVTVQYSVSPHKRDVNVLPADVYGKYNKSEHAYLKHLHGSSWHGNDARYIFWLEHYGLRAGLIGGVLLALAAGVLLWQHRQRQLLLGRGALLLPGGGGACCASGHCAMPGAGGKEGAGAAVASVVAMEEGNGHYHHHAHHHHHHHGHLSAAHRGPNGSKSVLSD